MKFGLLIIAVAQAEPLLNRSSREVPNPGGERRWSQLEDIMKFYDPDFQAARYFSYGCNCMMLGDRPMSDPGLGPPVDKYDKTCKHFKDCQKCVRMKHGNDCIGELHAYEYGESNGEKFCVNNSNTCKRAICECDLQFAQNHVQTKEYFNRDHHLFYSQTGWNSDTACAGGSGGSSVPECCGSPGGPMALYNSVKDACCSGEVQKGSTCS